MNAYDHTDYGYTPPALTGRIRSQILARELFAERVAEDRRLDAAIRRSLKGRRHGPDRTW